MDDSHAVTGAGSVGYTDISLNNSFNSNPSLPRNILAFRTISTLLAGIKQKPFTYSNASESEVITPEHKKELRISSALANIAAANTDFIALATKFHEHSIEVIVSTTVDDSCNQPITQLPCIVNAMAPDGVNSNSDKDLFSYIERFYMRPTLSEHLWVLSKLLLLDGGKHLSKYVIVTCYPKMIRRLEHKTSVSFINALKLVSMADVEFHEPRGKKVMDVHDQRFLVDFLIPAVDKGMIKAVIPNIVEQAKLASENKPYQLYSNLTHKEFHALLLELLVLFKHFLLLLRDAVDKAREHLPSSAPNSIEGCLDVALVGFLGFSFWRLNKGSALPMHLEVIGPLLRENRRVEVLTQTQQSKEDEQDEELEAVQPQAFRTTPEGDIQPQSLCTSYQEWLKLILVHFDAVNVLNRFVEMPTFRDFTTINIRMLVSPRPSKTLLGWRELFTNPEFSSVFSTQDTLQLFSGYEPYLSKDEIYETLSAVAQSDLDLFLEYAEAAKKAWMNSEGPNLALTKTKLAQLQACPVPQWGNRATEILDVLEATEALGAKLLQINELLESSFNASDFNFFKLLRLADENQLDFKGTVHCEASLASLLEQGINSDQYEDIRAQLEYFGPVISVSKRCCPACLKLFSLLTKATEKPFIVIGDHSTVSACSLPTWLPGHIVDSMNFSFGRQLKRKPVELLKPIIKQTDSLVWPGIKFSPEDFEYANYPDYRTE